MQYKVVPIVPVIRKGENVSHLVTEFESVIQKYADQGWDFVSLESLSTWVTGNSGCFGLGATPGYMDVKQMLIFRK
jgi:hypothetical protein